MPRWPKKPQTEKEVADAFVYIPSEDPERAEDLQTLELLTAMLNNHVKRMVRKGA
jgi:hypothetical protein